MGKLTRQRMVEAAAGLLQTGGLPAAAFTDVVRVSGAARGAIYHHFPGGKGELTRDAVVWTGERVRGELAAIGGEDAAGMVDGFLSAIRPVVEKASSGISCAVAAVTVQAAPGDSELSWAVGAAIGSWTDELSGQLERRGVGSPVARTVACLLVTFLEGTQVLCRAAGSLEPFDQAAPGLRLALHALVEVGPEQLLD